MNRETTGRFNSRTRLDAPNSLWETPPAVFARLNEDFGPFDVDLTADAKNHLLPRWFGPGGECEDALTASWSSVSHGYSNPPYGPFVQQILAVAANAAGTAFSNEGARSTFLLPMRVTVAFKRCVLGRATELLFCDRRLTFFENGAPRLNLRNFEKGVLTPDPAMFDSIIVRFGPPARLRVGTWHVPDHVSPSDLERAAARLRELRSTREHGQASDPVRADAPLPVE